MNSKVLKKICKEITCAAMAGAMLAGSIPAINVYAADAGSKESFRKEFVEMLETGDGSVHNIRHYNLTFSEYHAIVQDVQKKEGKLPYMCYRNQTTQSTKDGQYMNTFWLYSSDSGFSKRYEGLKKALEEVKEKISPEMSDLEKILICHDYIVNCTTYGNLNDSYGRMAVGPLSLSYGVCEGYAEALHFLLEEENIESKLVYSDSQNHCWLAVKLDGEWYHIDPTWDDTRSQNKGEVSHYFLIRNDQEFENSSYSRHYGWTDVVSDSEEYTDWYVHDVQGDMFYDDGCWYYTDKGGIVRNDIEGDSYELIVAGENLELEDVEEGMIYYTENGVEYSIATNENQNGIGGGSNVETVEPTETPTPEPSAAPTATATPTVTPAAVEKKHTELEWIEIKQYNLNTYFNTGITMKNTYKFQYKFQITVKNSYDNMFSSSSTKGEKLSLKQYAQGGIAGGYSWYVGTLCSTQLEKPITYTKDYNKLYIDDALVMKGPAMDFTCESELLFGTGRSRIYSFKIWDENGKAIRDYIPVLDEAGVPCMYDEVQKEYTYYTGYTGTQLGYQIAE